MDRVAAELVQSFRATMRAPSRSRRSFRALSGAPGRSEVWAAAETGFNIDGCSIGFGTTRSKFGGINGKYDVFHVIDHSYSQLVHRLPAGTDRGDLSQSDTFRSVLRPADEPARGCSMR